MQKKILNQNINSNTNITSKSNIANIPYIAIVSVLAYLVTFIIKIPVQFLSYDAKDVVIAVGGIILGIVPVVGIAFITALIEMLTISDSGLIGFFMNFLSSISYCLPIVFIYNYKAKKNNINNNITDFDPDFNKKSAKKLIFGIILGTLASSACMFAFNLIVTPIYLEISIEDTLALLYSLITPFNIIKGIVNGIFIFIIKDPILNALKKANLI